MCISVCGCQCVALTVVYRSLICCAYKCPNRKHKGRKSPHKSVANSSFRFANPIRVPIVGKYLMGFVYHLPSWSFFFFLNELCGTWRLATYMWRHTPKNFNYKPLTGSHGSVDFMLGSLYGHVYIVFWISSYIAYMRSEVGSNPHPLH